MAPVNWEGFQGLPGAPQTNFENICRAVIQIHYGRYGNLAARAAQPGVEFHLKLHTSCDLGKPGHWYGWQCRWYGLASGKAIGTTRRKKIEKSIRTTEKVLPGLTDWILWTRWPLVKSDQDWFYGLKTQMRLKLWTALEVEPRLGGDAAFLRNTYFGEWVLTPGKLTVWHEESVAPIRQRWLPEVHQVVDAERRLREALGEVHSWSSLVEAAQNLREGAKQVLEDQKKTASSIAKAVGDAATVARASADTLTEAHSALKTGDLNLLQQLLRTNLEMDEDIAGLPHRLRALRQAAALSVANVVADIRMSRKLLQDVNLVIGKGLIAVVAGAGCGKTQLSAQLTAPSSDRPAGVLLHGRNLNKGESLNSLAARLPMPSGVPVPSMEALIEAVDAAGQRAARRLPIVIDALNEAEDARDWRALLASLEQVVRRYPNVLVVCTLRGAFAHLALPDDVERVQMEDFGEAAVDAMVRYFKHYKIVFSEAELPFELLKHPLTLRLFCEVTNPRHELAVGIEAAPSSLSALFDGYLEQATQRIIELAPHARKFEKSEVARALHEIGVTLWAEKTRSLDVLTLRKTLGEESRQWTESIVSALEFEGVILRYPAEPPGSERLGVSYDLLAGHLAATAILARRNDAELDAWAKNPATVSAFGGPDWHPLGHDVFFALAALAPRRDGKQLWTMFEGPLRQKALRAAADLEGKYIDRETVTELVALVRTGPTGVEEIFKRLSNTRGMPGYQLNAIFLDQVLRSMSMADRDLRWTEWLRRERTYILSDLGSLERRWRRNATEGSEPDTLRAIWVTWLLTSTIRELRDQATRTIYWFGRRNPRALFTRAVDSLAINDPYVSERVLAASYGVAMALQNGKGADAFRDEQLPRFARELFDLMFGENAPLATTHSLRRDYAKGIIEVALRWQPGLLTSQEKSRIAAPFRGGIRNWGRRPDYDAGKYRDGNDPLGFDWGNYTMGGLARGRSTYDFKHPDFVRVKEEVLWRIHDLGYAFPRFGGIDAEIVRSRHYGQTEQTKPERYGKKYSWIAFYELWGFRSDAGLLPDKPWRGVEPHPEEVDLDPSFPDRSDSKEMLDVDVLGRRHSVAVKWVNKGPIPPVSRCFVRTNRAFPNDRWLLAHGGRYEHGSEVGRTGHVRVRAHFVAEGDLAKLKRFVKSRRAEFGYERDMQEIAGFFAGEFPWHRKIPYAETESVRVPMTRRKIKRPPISLRVISLGEEEIRIGDEKGPGWRYETVYESVELVPLAQRSEFGERSALERAPGLVPSKQIAEFARMWVGLPTWNMIDDRGKTASFAFSVPGIQDSGSSLLVRGDIVDAYMKKTKSRLIWIVSGERQRLKSSGMNAAYKQYLQVFVMERRNIKKLFETRDRRSN
jgi:phosphoribosylcarboxyaminoimidazole (NCAIR) mutase